MYNGIGKRPYLVPEDSSALQMARDRFEKQLLNDKHKTMEHEREQKDFQRQ